MGGALQLISTDKAVNPTHHGREQAPVRAAHNSLAQQRATHALFTSVRFGNVLGSRGNVVRPLAARLTWWAGHCTDRKMMRYF